MNNVKAFKQNSIKKVNLGCSWRSHDLLPLRSKNPWICLGCLGVLFLLRAVYIYMFTISSFFHFQVRFNRRAQLSLHDKAIAPVCLHAANVTLPVQHSEGENIVMPFSLCACSSFQQYQMHCSTDCNCQCMPAEYYVPFWPKGYKIWERTGLNQTKALKQCTSMVILNRVSLISLIILASKTQVLMFFIFYRFT